MKAKRKILSILVTLSMLAALLVPMASPALAYADYTALTTPTVADDTTANLGTVLIHTVAGAVYTGNPGTVNFRLPADFEFDWDALGADSNGDYVTDQSAIINVPANYSGDENGLHGCTFTIQRIAANEIQLKLTAIDDVNELNGNDGYIYLYLRNITIPSGVSGEVKLIASAPSSSGFGSGEVVVGKVKSEGDVTITVDEVNTFTDSCDAVLRFKESIAGSFEVSNKSVKLRLPGGFEWDEPADTADTLLWGSQAFLDNLTFRVDGRDLYVEVAYASNDRDHLATTGATYFYLPVSFSVTDESKAKYGDVTVSISGASTLATTSLVIGKYAEMGATIKCDTPLDVTAGKTEQEIGKIVIEEAAPGSLVSGRSIILTLPANAKWGAYPNVSTENGISIDNSLGDSGFDLVGTDGRSLKFKINDESTDEAGKITLEKAEVILAGDVTGNLDIEVSGTADVEGKITVAKIFAPVTVSVKDKKEVKIGLNDQPVGDIIITEGLAEAITDDENLEITLPSGVSFSEVPDIEVTDGDLDVDSDNARLTDNDNKLIIPIDAESTKASTIKISGVKLDIDRTVPVGDLKVKVGGLAVNEVNDPDTLRAYYTGTADDDNYYRIEDEPVFRIDDDGAFPGATTVASAVIATCVTPAPGQTTGTVVFKIGDTKYTVNGVEKTMDVAPYLKNDRTYMPVRYVAEALGVASDNIMWNQADQTVVLIKGDRVVKLTIGSTTMYINGVAFNMDVAPELVDPGRTMLPIRWVGQALGATLTWDGATQTVTVTQ